MAKKTTKKRATRKKKTTRKPKPTPVSRALVSAVVVELVVRGDSEDQIRSRHKEPKIDAAIGEAWNQIAGVARIDKETAIGLSLSRMSAAYWRAMAADQYSAAVSAEVQIIKLRALYPKDTPDGGSSTPERSDELDEVAAHLIPLGLAPKGHPIAGVARLAAARIRELEAEI